MNTQLKIVPPDYNQLWEGFKERNLQGIKEKTERAYKFNKNTRKCSIAACIIFFSIVSIVTVSLFIPTQREWFNSFIDEHVGVFLILAATIAISTRMAMGYLLSPNKAQFKDLDFHYREIVKLLGILKNTKLSTPEDFVKLEETWDALWCEYLYPSSIWSSFSARMMRDDLGKLFEFHELERYTAMSYKHDHSHIMIDVADNQGNVTLDKRYACKIQHNTNVEMDTLSLESRGFVLTKKYIPENKEV